MGGVAWRAALEEALSSAPFFIAIVTPKFVKSEECRREILTFVAQANSRGIGKLLLPILLVNVPDLREDSEDEVLALLARTQYVDWTEHRLRGEGDPLTIKALNDLALRIMELQEEVQVSLEAAQQKAETDDQGTVEQVLADINQSLPAWLDAVDFDPMGRAQWNASWDQSIARANRVFRQYRGVSGPYLSVWARLANEIAPLSERRLNEAKAYHRAPISPDAPVTAAIRLVHRTPSLNPLLNDLRSGISEAMLSIEGESKTSWVSDSGAGQYNAKLKQSSDRVTDSMSFAGEANEIVKKWNQQLATLDAHLRSLGKVEPEFPREHMPAAGLPL